MKIIFTLLLINISVNLFSQDRVVKIDKSIIHGKVVAFDGQKVILLTNDKTEMRIPKENVSEIKFGKEEITVEYVDTPIDSKALDSIGRYGGSFGTSPLVNGFGGRAIKSSPKLSSMPNKTGKIVLDVCLNTEGEVVSSKFKAVGSTTTDNELVNAAIKHSKSIKFSKTQTEKQCGTISYNFK